MTITKQWFADAEIVLIEIAGSILQTNKSVSSKLLDAVVAKGVGVAGAAGITGLVSALGTASTGTAIGTLTGAAATTAKLYWIGSLVGGGVAAGAGLLGAAGIAAGFGFARYWRGTPRSIDDLEEHEREILSAIELLVPVLREEAGKDRPLTTEEIDAVHTIWADLSASFDIYLREDARRLLSPKHLLRAKLARRKQKKLLKRIRS